MDNPNSIHAFNRFEEEGHVERKYNHLRLIDLTREELYVIAVPGILDDEELKIFYDPNWDHEKLMSTSLM